MNQKNPRETQDNVFIHEVIRKVEKSLGEKSLLVLGEESVSDVKEWIPTGSIVLDKIIGGGIPVGRIIEIFGEEGTGKSTLGWSVLSNTQKLGGIGLLIDTETSYDSDRAKSLGLDTNSLLYAQVDTIEDVFDMISITTKEIRQKKPDSLLTIVWDSVAATSTKAEIEGQLGDSFYGAHAKMLSAGFRKYKRFLTWDKVTLVCINQIRQNIGSSFFGPSVVTFGGEAVKFYASVRLHLVSKRKIEHAGKVIGIDVKVRTVKNKVYSPYRETRIVIDFEKGIDDVVSSIFYLLDKGVLKNQVGWIEYNNKKWRESELENYFRSNQKELVELVKNAKE